MSEPSGSDCTFLGVTFALNASFAYVDSFMRSFMESMRDDFNRLVAKYRDQKWIESVANGNSAEALGKKERLVAVAKEALELENEIPKLFTEKARFWKRVMVVTSVFLLCCMVIPYRGRILVLLALPVPVFLHKCAKERDDFNIRAQEACREIDKSYERIKNSTDVAPDTERNAILNSLGKVEKTLEVLVAKLDPANQSPASSASLPPARLDSK